MDPNSICWSHAFPFKKLQEKLQNLAILFFDLTNNVFVETSTIPQTQHTLFTGIMLKFAAKNYNCQIRSVSPFQKLNAYHNESPFLKKIFNAVFLKGSIFFLTNHTLVKCMIRILLTQLIIFVCRTPIPHFRNLEKNSKICYLIHAICQKPA